MTQISQDFEVQHLLQQLHLANSDIEALQHSVAELKNEDQLRSQQRLQRNAERNVG
jgi:TolA-binding protein